MYRRLTWPGFVPAHLNTLAGGILLNLAVSYGTGENPGRVLSIVALKGRGRLFEHDPSRACSAGKAKMPILRKSVLDGRVESPVYGRSIFALRPVVYSGSQTGFKHRSNANL